MSAYEKFTKELVPTVNGTEKMGDSELVTAIKSGNLETVNEVLSGSDLLNVRTGDLRHTPLQIAVCQKDGDCIQIVKALLEAGAPINALDNTGNLAIHHLCGNAPRPMGGAGTGGGDTGGAEMAAVLVEAGSLLDLPNKGGFTPMMLAVKFQRADVIKCLTAAKADVNVKNSQGHTALDYAMGYRHDSGRLVGEMHGVDVEATLRAATTIKTAHEETNERLGPLRYTRTVTEAYTATQARMIATEPAIAARWIKA